MVAAECSRFLCLLLALSGLFVATAVRRCLSLPGFQTVAACNEQVLLVYTPPPAHPAADSLFTTDHCADCRAYVWMVVASLCPVQGIFVHLELGAFVDAQQWGAGPHSLGAPCPMCGRVYGGDLPLSIEANHQYRRKSNGAASHANSSCTAKTST